MNVTNGNVYPSYNFAVQMGEDPAELIEVIGTEEQVRQVSEALREKNRAKNKAARKARRRNRR